VEAEPEPTAEDQPRLQCPGDRLPSRRSAKQHVKYATAPRFPRWKGFAWLLQDSQRSFPASPYLGDEEVSVHVHGCKDRAQEQHEETHGQVADAAER